MGSSARPRLRFADGAVYQLRVELEGVTPVVWRRLQVSGRASLHELHGAIQRAFGLDDADGYSLAWLAERVHEALGALGVDRCDVLAHSLGGAVAVELATTVPALVRRLVLVDAVVFPMELPLEGRMALLPQLGPFLWKQLYRRSELRRHLVRVLSTPELLDERAVDVYWDRLGRDGGREAAYAMLQQMTRLEPLRDRLPRVQAPTLVVWGDRDALMPVDTGERIAKLVPGAQLRVVEGCGHDVPEERPEVLVELVREHL